MLLDPDSIGFLWQILLMVLGMCCWGTWALPLKIKGKYLPRADVFYVDVLIAMLLSSLLMAVSLGYPEFYQNVFGTQFKLLAWPFLAGFILNIGNFFSSVGTAFAGLAVRMLLSSGVSAPLGTLLSRIIQVVGYLPLVLVSIGLSMCACGTSGLMHALKNRELPEPGKKEQFTELQEVEKPQQQTEEAPIPEIPTPSLHSKFQKIGDLIAKHSVIFGAVICLLSGLLNSTWSPICALTIREPNSPDVYTIQVYFVLGICCNPISTVMSALFPMSPGDPRLTWAVYKNTPILSHLASLGGGVLLSVGHQFMFIAGGNVGMAVAYGIGGASPLIGTAWGVVFGEFRGTSWKVKSLLCTASLLYAGSVAAITCSAL